MTECPALSTSFLTRLDQLLVSTFDTTPGTRVTLDCVDGYQLNGPQEIECRNDGTWSYSTKPECVFIRPTTEAPKPDDEDQRILIGVVCAVAAFLVLLLFAMILLVYCRARKAKKERMRSGLSRRDVAMYARQQSLYSQSRRGQPDDLDRRSRDFDRRSRDLDMESSIRGERPVWRTSAADDYREPRLGNSLCLPRDWRDRDLDLRGDSPYATPEWVSRGSLNGSRNSMRDLDLPGIHSQRGGSYLWRHGYMTPY